MRHVVCYDVTDDGRRSRLADCLKDFGARVQESVFVADLDDDLVKRMRERIQAIVDPHLDAVHVFAQCRACEGRTEVHGIGHVPGDQDFYIL